MSLQVFIYKCRHCTVVMGHGVVSGSVTTLVNELLDFYGSAQGTQTFEGAFPGGHTHTPLEDEAPA